MGVRWAQYIAKVTVEIVNVGIATESEHFFAKAHDLHQDAVVKILRPTKVRHRNVDVINPGYFCHSAVNSLLACGHLRTAEVVRPAQNNAINSGFFHGRCQ